MSEISTELTGLDQYPFWNHPYKWSGTNSTWVEYLYEAIKEIDFQKGSIPLDPEYSKQRERACKVLKILWHCSCNSRS